MSPTRYERPPRPFIRVGPNPCNFKWPWIGQLTGTRDHDGEHILHRCVKPAGHNGNHECQCSNDRNGKQTHDGRREPFPEITAMRAGEAS